MSATSPSHRQIRHLRRVPFLPIRTESWKKIPWPMVCINFMTKVKAYNVTGMADQPPAHAYPSQQYDSFSPAGYADYRQMPHSLPHMVVPHQAAPHPGYASRYPQQIGQAPGQQQDMVAARNNSVGGQQQPNGMYSRNLIGSLVSSGNRLDDVDGKVGVWFVLQDLSVRTEGWFR